MVARAVFIDRDGVINESMQRDGLPVAPTRLEDFRLLPGVADALAQLKQAGFLLVVVTNQPDIATGRASRAVVEAMNDQIMGRLPIDDIRVCAHVNADNCDCRKPKPGLLLDAAKEHAIELSQSWMIGDRWRDVGAGQAAGCRTVFIDYDYPEARPDRPDLVVRSLAEAVPLVISSSLRRTRIMPDLQSLKIKIFADGADLQGMKAMYANPLIKGFTTNPTLMKAAGVTDYADFARKVLAAIPDRPVSFEVFADDFDEMEHQAMEIASWGRNVNVKIPVTNTQMEFCGPLVSRLSKRGVQLNVTAVFTLDQVRHITEALAPETPAIVSVFAGRIADSGIDPVPVMREAARILEARPRAELLWASPRELLNVIQADEVGCRIITCTNDILKKLPLIGKDQDAYSLETVKMFYNDARAAGFTIRAPALAE